MPDEPTGEELGEQEEDRARYLSLILGSPAQLRLIVSGPGTGKSYTFRKVLEQRAGNYLALTFINALRTELDAALGDLATVRTFHGFCKGLLHQMPVAGLTAGVDYYPAFSRLQAEDIELVDDLPVGDGEVDRVLHTLDSGSGLLPLLLRSGDYYDAVGHSDSVYRVWLHLRDHPDQTPTYDLIVVDEYQDFSLLEAQFIEALSSNRMLIAGDDDQALYGFKHASPEYLRQLSADGRFATFQLPYCSRCTSVMVEAVGLLVAKASASGLMKERIDKEFICYMPAKHVESALYPKIIHAHCTVQTAKAPLMARYVHERISKIPQNEIDESRSDGYPTVLVTGPTQFTKPIAKYLAKEFDDVTVKESAKLEVTVLDGYRRLAKDKRSRLGWRIVMHMEPPPDVPAVLHGALKGGRELIDLLPSAYVHGHLEIVALLNAMVAGEALSAEGQNRLATGVELSLDELARLLDLVDEGEEEGEQEPESVPDKKGPSILVTSLLGAKGLQAGHVFVVGLNEGHFPRADPTDDEVCSLLVALTRGRKSCTLVSCGRFGAEKVQPSRFLSPLKPVLDAVKIDAAYFKGAT